MEILVSFIEFSPEKKTLEVWFRLLFFYPLSTIKENFALYFCSSIFLFKTITTLTVMNDAKSFHFYYRYQQIAYGTKWYFCFANWIGSPRNNLWFLSHNVINRVNSAFPEHHCCPEKRQAPLIGEFFVYWMELFCQNLDRYIYRLERSLDGLRIRLHLRKDRAVLPAVTTLKAYTSSVKFDWRVLIWVNCLEAMSWSVNTENPRQITRCFSASFLCFILFP